MPVAARCSRNVSSRCNRRRRGSVLILGAALLTVLACLVGLAVDLGYLNMVRTQLQAAADAGALAGADTLFDSGSFSLAEAERFAELNVSGNVPVDIRSGEDIEIGVWNRRQQTFTPQIAIDSSTNAVRLTARRSDARGNAVNLFFARVIGINTHDVSASAIAQAQNGLCGGIIGLNRVTLNGNAYTDSYYSEDGSYAGQAPRSNGHVCSNGDITLAGGATVNGNATTLESASVNIIGTSAVTGSTQPRPDPIYAPPVIVGDAATNNDNANITGQGGGGGGGPHAAPPVVAGRPAGEVVAAAVAGAR